MKRLPSMMLGLALFSWGWPIAALAGDREHRDQDRQVRHEASDHQDRTGRRNAESEAEHSHDSESVTRNHHSGSPAPTLPPNGGGSTPPPVVVPPPATTTPPSMTLPASITVEAGAPQTVVSLGIATATDGAGNTIAVTSDAPTAFPLGATVVTYTATDAWGNVATATQTVTVVDTTPPQLTPPPNVIIEASSVLTPADFGIASAADLVDGSVMVSNNAPTAFPLGTTTVTYTAGDLAGNVANAIQTVTVVDTTPPQVTPPQASVATSPDGSAVAMTLSPPVGTDLFGPVTWSSNAPPSFPLGVTLVTWAGSDANGNQATATQVVLVSAVAASPSPDPTPPPGVILPPDPGAVGRTTVEGIDSDGDGVRDDVQIWIEANYPNSERMRMALRQLAVATQEYLKGAADPDHTFQNHVVISRALSCLYFVSPTPKEAHAAFVDLDATVLNTLTRSRTMLSADRHLSGMILRGYKGPRNESCYFDPNALAN